LSVNSFLTFVDILTRSIRSSAITSWASAITDSASHGDTFSSSWAGLFSASAVGQETCSSDDAIRWLTAAFDAIAKVAALERIAFVAFRTGAVVTSWQILTNGPEATGRFVGW
jgi:dolichyl-phosphate-mannose--protein O-mannosyl transferase